MKYYYHPLSPSCRKTTAMIDHLGIEAEHCLVDLPKGDQMKPELEAINPNRKVPALVDGASKIWESNAIAIYLAELEGSELWPEEPERRLDVLRWMFWEQGHFMRETGAVFFEVVIKPMIGQGEPDKEVVGKAIERFRHLASVLDGQLQGSRYIVGAQLSLADWAVASHLGYAEPSGLPIAEYSNITRWLADLDESEAWRRSAPTMAG